METDKCVGRNIRKFRHGRSMTLSGVSGLLGISRQQLQKYETGYNRIHATMIVRLADVLNVGIDDLFGRGEMPGMAVASPITQARQKCDAQILRVHSVRKMRLMARILRVIAEED